METQIFRIKIIFFFKKIKSEFYKKNIKNYFLLTNNNIKKIYSLLYFVNLFFSLLI
jgi:hypothetical protein